MNSKLASFADTAKKKAGAVLICGALVATVGAGAAWAANSIATLDVIVEDGVTKYSTDGGKTWGKQAPGVTERTTPDGEHIVTNGTPPKEGEAGQGTLAKVEDGVTSYSTDGGKTWSEKASEGAGESSTVGN
jgi:Neuraminidase (sialidase)